MSDFDEDFDQPVVPDSGHRNDASPPNRDEKELRPALEYKHLNGPVFERGEFRFIGELLGEGAQGTVRKAENVMLGTCAVKEMAVARSCLGRGGTMADYEARCREEFLRERQILTLQLATDAKREFVLIDKVSHHDKIVGFRGYLTKWENAPAFGLVTLYTGLIFEFMAGGTLENMIKRDQGDLGDFHSVPSPENPPALSYQRVRGYAIDIGQALTFLHEKLRILHRHIHPSNIFLTGDFSVAKLGDFGYSREKNPDLMTAQKGAIHYMAPEVIQENEMVKYGFKSEVWSFSMLLYAMLCKREPCLTNDNNEEITNERDQRNKLNQGRRPILEDSYRKAFPDMVKRIEEGWKTKSYDRPSMMEMLQNLMQTPEYP